MTTLVSVLREHGDGVQESHDTDESAREFAVSALYLIEDELLPETAPLPTWRELERFARDNGWILFHTTTEA